VVARLGPVGRITAGGHPLQEARSDMTISEGPPGGAGGGFWLHAGVISRARCWLGLQTLAGEVHRRHYTNIGKTRITLETAAPRYPPAVGESSSNRRSGNSASIGHLASGAVARESRIASVSRKSFASASFVNSTCAPAVSAPPLRLASRYERRWDSHPISRRQREFRFAGPHYWLQL
jgi:hypothetical protein